MSVNINHGKRSRVCYEEIRTLTIALRDLGPTRGKKAGKPHDQMEKDLKGGQKCCDEMRQKIKATVMKQYGSSV